ncbi:hypothetical protein OAB00_02160 [Akkermansiaceae bacterium]|nr:hypothetical protein [Akkermansiaceae bacterium]
MKSHESEWIKDRISWKAKQHRLPNEHTKFWPDAPSYIKLRLPNDFHEPVLYSLSKTGTVTILGVDELCVISSGEILRLNLDEITKISIIDKDKEIEKLDLDQLCVHCNGKFTIPTEKGKSAFAIWGILEMLIRMKK